MMDELRPLTERFRRQQLPPAEWTHEAHVRVALFHVLEDSELALERMRAGIQALNAANGIPQTETGGYHETLTRFWLTLVRKHWAGEWAPFWAVLGDKKLPLRHYSRERLMSREARSGWLEPDLQPL